MPTHREANIDHVRKNPETESDREPPGEVRWHPAQAQQRPRLWNERDHRQPSRLRPSHPPSVGTVHTRPLGALSGAPAECLERLLPCQDAFGKYPRNTNSELSIPERSTTHFVAATNSSEELPQPSRPTVQGKPEDSEDRNLEQDKQLLGVDGRAGDSRIFAVGLTGTHGRSVPGPGRAENVEADAVEEGSGMFALLSLSYQGTERSRGTSIPRRNTPACPGAGPTAGRR